MVRCRNKWKKLLFAVFVEKYKGCVCVHVQYIHTCPYYNNKKILHKKD